MRKVGKALFFIGLALTVLGTVLGIVGIVQSVSAASGLGSSAQSGPAAVSITGEPGAEWTIFTDTSGGSTCTVTDETGGNVDVRVPSSSMNVSSGSTEWHRQAVFTTPDAGTYLVECGPMQETVFVVASSQLSGVFTWITVAVVSFVVAGLMSLVLVLGLILWLVGRGQERSRAQAATGPANPNQYPPAR